MGTFSQSEPFKAALDGCVPAQLVGQLLGQDERPAVLADMTPNMRRAISIAHDADRLDWFGRLGWHRAGARKSIPIGDGTVSALHARGLVVIVSKGRFRKHARITERGRWFARSVNSAALNHIKEIVKNDQP